VRSNIGVGGEWYQSGIGVERKWVESGVIRSRDAWGAGCT
jgi:hypothetical protein